MKNCLMAEKQGNQDREVLRLTNDFQFWALFALLFVLDMINDTIKADLCTARIVKYDGQIAAKAKPYVVKDLNKWGFLSVSKDVYKTYATGALKWF